MHLAPTMNKKNVPALLLTTTPENRPFWLNVHVKDVGHTAILGPTSNGKSTLIDAILTAHRKYAGSRIIVLDKDFSHRSIIQALEGAYFDLSETSCQLAPLARLTLEDLVVQQQAVSWLTECCVLQGVEMTPERQKALREAVARLSVESSEYKNLQHLSLQEPTVRQAIETFSQGNYRHLLNGTVSQLKESSVLGFEMGALTSVSSQKQDLRLAVIKALFNELEFLFWDKQPTLLILEEAWAYLKHPLFFEKLTDWFKTLRKANVAVVFISQDLSDIANSQAASIIQNSCMTRIYLPNAAAQEPTVRHFYQQFGLNDRQIEIIQQAQPKQDYYYDSVLGSRLFRLDLGELAKSFFAISRKDEMEVFNQHYSKTDSSWILSWLEHKGLWEWRDYVAKNYVDRMDEINEIRGQRKNYAV